MADRRRNEAEGGRVLILIMLGIQVIAAALFLFNLMIPILGIPLILDWSVHEAIELVAAISLLTGVVMTVLLLRRMQRRAEHLESQLRAASGAFLELLEEKFEHWSLTPAERDVALFSIKGVSTQEIASLRNTSEGTVKAQTNAIYRKAGVSGRPQLLSLFIDDLMDGPLC
jgi:DNA-binding CsgD family transcriptional regulator